MIPKLVIDTNILLVCISERAENHWLFEAFIDEVFTLCVTTEILNEYSEIIEQHMGLETSENLLNVISNTPNVLFIDKYLRWGLISVDPDDNKFVDCAVASNAKYIVTHDKHYNVLKTLEFPRIDIMNIEECKRFLFKDDFVS